LKEVVMTTSQVETPVAATPTTATPEAAPSGRDPQGRFGKGNPGGPGNPFARRAAAMRKAFSEALAEEDWMVLAKELMARAQKGDNVAAKLVCQYGLGKATPSPDPDRLDSHEWDIFKDEAGKVMELATMIGKPHLDFGIQAMRVARPAVAAEYAPMFAASLRDPEGFWAAQDKAEDERLRPLERDVLRRHAQKYGDIIPDETGLPPGVRPIEPKRNGANGGKRRDRGRSGVPLRNGGIGDPPRVCQHPPRAEAEPPPMRNGENGRR
jgi:hypothetical protein